MAPTIGRHPSTLLRTLLPASLLSLAACGPAVEEAQQPVITSKHELTGTWRQDGLLQGCAGGTSSATMTLAATGDENGDGVDEYAIGAPGVTLGTLTNAGQVSIHDGATGAQVSVLNGTASGQWFGEGLLAGPKSKALYVATWHADGYNGRVYLYRWVP